MSYEELIQQLKEQSGDISYLINSYPLSEGDVIDCGNDCFFEKPPEIGTKNPLKFLTIEELNLSLKENLPYFGRDFRERICIGLNQNMIRVTDGKVKAACDKLGVNRYCTTKVIYGCCPKYKADQVK